MCYSIRYSTAQNNFHVTTYLLRQEHDTLSLLDDRKFVLNLVVVGKNHKHKPIEDFVFFSPAPCYTAACLSALYREAALREKDRAADLLEIGDVCEELAKDLVGIGNSNIKVNNIGSKNNLIILKISCQFGKPWCHLELFGQ